MLAFQFLDLLVYRKDSVYMMILLGNLVSLPPVCIQSSPYQISGVDYVLSFACWNAVSLLLASAYSLFLFPSKS